MWFIAMLGLLAIANAREFLSKRALVTLDNANMNIFSEQFHTTLMHIVAEEWERTQPLVEELKTEMPICENKMDDRRNTCETCAKDVCSPSVGEIIENIGNEMGNEIKDFFTDAGNEFVNWKVWDDIGGFFTGIGNKFVGWEGWADMGDFFENIGKAFTSWSGWKHLAKLGEGFIDFGETLGEGFGDIGTGIVDIGKDIGKGFGDIGKDIGKGFSKAFGWMGRRKRAVPMPYRSSYIGSYRRSENVYPNRRSENLYPYRRSAVVPYRRAETDYLRRPSENVYPLRRQITPEVRECMEQCRECEPFLLPMEEMVGRVCGNDLVELNRTVQMVVHKIELLYNRMVENGEPVLTHLKYDTGSMVNLAFETVRLTGFFETGTLEYDSNVPYSLMAVSKTAALMAREYFERFMQI